MNRPSLGGTALYRPNKSCSVDVIKTTGGTTSIIINNDILWITGLYDNITSEFIQLNGTIQGPDLPIKLRSHAIVNMNDYLTMLIGGQFRL